MLLSEIMHDYFGDKRCSQSLTPLVESSHTKFAGKWQKVDSPERLVKDFVFDSRAALLQFVTETLAFEDKAGHHGKITIESTTVRIEIYTHDIDEVTELDYEYAKYVDDIALDVEVIYGRL